MPRLPQALRDWQTADFGQTLKAEIERLPSGLLPLQLGLNEGGRVDDSDICALVISTSDGDGFVQSKLGIFFTEVTGGCNCADDPVERKAYCELEMRLDKRTAEASFLPLTDG